MRKTSSKNHKSASAATSKRRARKGNDNYHVESDVGLSRHVQRVIRANRNGGLLLRRGF